ncbi:MAG: hypothetical protein P4L41_15815 [Flavipsychrobacter sp.]|nr:hypothetical protein [Flavipsychrobacter sp.]
MNAWKSFMGDDMNFFTFWRCPMLSGAGQGMLRTEQFGFSDCTEVFITLQDTVGWKPFPKDDIHSSFRFAKSLFEDIITIISIFFFAFFFF